MKKTNRWLLTCAAGLCLALLVMPGTAKAAGTCPECGEDLVEFGEEAPSCEKGYGAHAGLRCPVCLYVDQEVVYYTVDHDWRPVDAVPATCEASGVTAGKICNRCGAEEGFNVIPKLPHQMSTEPHEVETPATCKPGKTAVYICELCHIYTEGGETIDPIYDHTPYTPDYFEAKAPNCATGEYGQTEGKMCSECGTVLVMPTRLKPEHTVVVDPAVPATETENGWTEGSHCEACGEVIVAQVVIPATGVHTCEPEPIPDVAPTCTRSGHTGGTRCSICHKTLEEPEEVQATGHTEEVNVSYRAPTATRPGRTEGTWCSVCHVILTRSVEIPATGGNTGGNTGDNPGGNTGGTETPVGPGDNGEPGDEEDLEDPDTPLADKPFLFEDVAKGKWYYDAIYYVYQRGLMNGNNKSGTLFSPNENTNRAMIVTILDLLTAENDLADLMVPLAGEPKSFPDVLVGKWYTEHVLWATAAGIVGGYKEGTFGPLDDVTREQLVVILYQYAGKLGADQSGRADLSGYEDADKVSRYAREAMEWAVDLGLLTGRKDGGVVRLDPKGTATRAEVAVVMMNFCKLVVDAE